MTSDPAPRRAAPGAIRAPPAGAAAGRADPSAARATPPGDAGAAHAASAAPPRRATPAGPARAPRPRRPATQRQPGRARAGPARDARPRSRARTQPPQPPRRRAPRRTARVGHAPRRVRIMLGVAFFVLTLFAAQLLRIQGLDASRWPAAPSAAGPASAAAGLARPDPGRRRQAAGAVGRPAQRHRRPDAGQRDYGVPARSDGGPARRARPGAPPGSPARPACWRRSSTCRCRQVTAKLTGTRRFTYVTKGITPEVWDHVASLQHPRDLQRADLAAGLPAGRPGRRRSSASSAADGKPLGGLELAAEHVADRQGRARSATRSSPDGVDHRDRAGRPDQRRARVRTSGSPSTRTCSGRPRRCSPTRSRKTQALSGTVVVMDVKTGDLLALAAAPTFDPANYGKAPPTSLVDQALAGVYEPGSTSKVMTAAAALAGGRRHADHRRSRCPARCTGPTGPSTTRRPTAPSSSPSPACSPSPATSAPSRSARGCRRRPCGATSPSSASASRPG